MLVVSLKRGVVVGRIDNGILLCICGGVPRFKRETNSLIPTPLKRSYLCCAKCSARSIAFFNKEVVIVDWNELVRERRIFHAELARWGNDENNL